MTNGAKKLVAFVSFIMVTITASKNTIKNTKQKIRY